MHFYPRYGKRFFDCMLIGIAVVLILAVLAVIILAYALTGNWPPIFRQSRIGCNGEIFTMYKFRTLRGDDQMLLSKRIFGLGKILRFTNLDELPQVWNVLKGEMSLVGPRPLPVEYANLFSSEQNMRHNVLPGITGLAQVSGKNNLSWEEKFKLDIDYVRNVSFTLDIRILLKTIILAFSFRKDTSLSEEKFTG